MTPLELWDLWVGEHILWDGMQDADFPDVLRHVLIALRRGEGATRSEGRVPLEIAGYDSLLVAGRRSEETGIQAALATFDVPVFFSRTPENPGLDGGLRLLAGRGGAAPWICDLGQASLKVCSATVRKQYPRDLRRLPIRRDSPDESIEEQRQQLRQWLAASLKTFAEINGSPDTLIFALPSRLDDAGVPEGSSYIGMGGDALLITDVIGASRLEPRAVLVVNDAELAALDALDEPAFESFQKTLVITLGFGLGAALASRTSDHSYA